MSDASQPIEGEPADDEKDREVKATQTIVDVPARCDATARLLNLIVLQNGNELDLVGFGRHPKTGNVVLRFRTR